jgi:hypothetical protein
MYGVFHNSLLNFGGLQPRDKLTHRDESVLVMPSMVICCDVCSKSSVTEFMSVELPFYRRLGGSQSRSGRYGEVKMFYLTGTRTPAPHDHPASRYTD